MLKNPAVLLVLIGCFSAGYLAFCPHQPAVSIPRPAYERCNTRPIPVLPVQQPFIPMLT